MTCLNSLHLLVTLSLMVYVIILLSEKWQDNKKIIYLKAVLSNAEKDLYDNYSNKVMGDQ